MTDRIFELAYMSEARRPFSTMELSLLLRASRLRNARAGITGLLLYADRSFLQVLEGPRDVVTKTFAKIAGDERHRRVVHLFESEKQGRHFGDWSMSFVDGRSGTATSFAGQVDFLRTGYVDLQAIRGPAQALLDEFRRGRWRSTYEYEPSQSQMSMPAVGRPR